MKEATTIAHPHPPSSPLVDGAMLLMLLLPSAACDNSGGSPGKGHSNRKKDVSRPNN